ncbi:hypothetical protein HHK36_017021 [Tetracentron sinense]|uniref:Endoplasmic reticulum vesicle transporter N-terminal domain-containing protein n=1 Tax=Tetracentron sinense TaxID=13715 RepID=A0A834Z1X7_TETSI|nr:hypothetical protein HHK36_017021 [Tetracentron sinense]
MEILNRLRNIDAYPKINEDFYSRTLSGGLITLFSSIVMLFLFFSELSFVQFNSAMFALLGKSGVRLLTVSLLIILFTCGLFLHAVTETKLVVDNSRGGNLRVNFDVTFPALACSLLSVDAMDISGEQHYDIVCLRHDIMKKRIDHLGNVIESKADGIGAPKRHGGRLDHNETYCGSCYGAEVAKEIRFRVSEVDWKIGLIGFCRGAPEISRLRRSDSEYLKWTGC